ncbi:hypothetical protein EYZ11_003152 [Aspergillus tanneri]|uniref:Uncharacterized protein n=1 Tax=Aspergillus tanneri TaxID=1220188 RepID=A0A4S3JNX2_9EURO|nr:hypothetical protein EYZ11_003152 [Aspergillus tanneri]
MFRNPHETYLGVLIVVDCETKIIKRRHKGFWILGSDSQLQIVALPMNP